MHRPGSIRLLTTPGRVKEADYMISRNWGGTTPLWKMSLDEIHKTAPFMNMDGVLGGLWTPGITTSFLDCTISTRKQNI